MSSDHEHCWHPWQNHHLGGTSRWMECCTFECDVTRPQTPEELAAVLEHEEYIESLLAKARKEDT